jgi:predicted AlkP superfamily pyrophosphatase or phosphodiesterase
MLGIAVRVACVALVLLLAACSGMSPRPPARDAAPLLLISIDGMRTDYLDLGITPNLQRLAQEGVRARWMTPSYPVLTFPNHYSIVTGLRPDRHGIVHNDMRDPKLGRFRLSDRDAVGHGAWWGGEPIWVSAEKAGLSTAAYYWPGTEAAIAGVRPRRWRPFDDSVPYASRVDDVLGWLRADADERPRFLTLYFEGVDKKGHDFGPASAEVRKALVEADAAIGRLLAGLRRQGQLDRMNLVLVSDHGMAEVPPGQVVDLAAMVDPADVTVVSAGQVVGVNPLPGHAAVAEARLLGRHAHYQCWRKGELPSRWHFGKHPRVPAIVCQMDEGWDALPRSFAARRTPGAPRGSHGYDPALASMRTIFLARGPAFRRGVVIDPIDNVDVYPLLAQLLGIEAVGDDGNPDALADGLHP